MLFENLKLYKRHRGGMKS